jgi:hypothetical protein
MSLCETNWLLSTFEEPLRDSKDSAQSELCEDE